MARQKISMLSKIKGEFTRCSAQLSIERLSWVVHTETSVDWEVSFKELVCIMPLKSELCWEVVLSFRDGCFVCLGYCIGISYAFLWYGSILLGFYFLYAPLLPLILVNRKLFRRITDCLLSSWESFNTVNRPPLCQAQLIFVIPQFLNSPKRKW